MRIKLKTLFLLLCLSIFSINAYGESYIPVQLIPFDVQINGESLLNEAKNYRYYTSEKYYYRTEHPSLLVNDIVYVPLTYDILNLMYLNMSIDGNEIKIEKRVGMEALEYTYWWRRYEISKENIDTPSNVVLCPFDIFIEGEKYSDEDYPFLFFNDIIYMPLTWSVTANFSGWEYSFDDDGLKLFTEGYIYSANGYPTFTLEKNTYRDSDGIEREGEGRAYIITENLTYYKKDGLRIFVRTASNRFFQIMDNLVINNNAAEIKVSGYTGFDYRDSATVADQKNGPLFTVEDGFIYTVHYSDHDKRDSKKCKIDIETGEVIYLE